MQLKVFNRKCIFLNNTLHICNLTVSVDTCSFQKSNNYKCYIHNIILLHIFTLIKHSSSRPFELNYSMIMLKISEHHSKATVKTCCNSKQRKQHLCFAHAVMKSSCLTVQTCFVMIHSLDLVIFMISLSVSVFSPSGAGGQALWSDQRDTYRNRKHLNTLGKSTSVCDFETNTACVTLSSGSNMGTWDFPHRVVKALSCIDLQGCSSNVAGSRRQQETYSW